MSNTSLPFLTRLIAAVILAKENKLLIAELAYLRAEIGFLRAQLPEGVRLMFTDVWRKRLARAASGIELKRHAEIATAVKTSRARRSTPPAWRPRAARAVHR